MDGRKVLNKRKIVNYFLILIVLVVAFFVFRTYSLRDVCNDIIEFNLEMSQEKFIWIFLIYWGEIFIVLIFWVLLVDKISLEVSLLLDRLSEYLLKTKKIRLAILCIRVNYGFSKLMYFLRLGWRIHGSSENDKIVWNSIRRPPIKDILLGVFFALIKLPALIAIFLTAISLTYLELNDIQEIVKNLSSFKFDFWEDIKLISPLTVVVLIVFIGYFISFRGNIRRAIAQANRKKMEDIIQKQRDLVEIIGDSLYSISSNLQYVIECQDLVADLWIHSRFPSYEDDRYKLWSDLSVEHYCFKDIPELEIISQKFDELNSNGNWGASRAFSSYKYEFLTLVSRSRLLNSVKLNEIFFTEKGMKTLINNDEHPIIEYSKEQIEKMRKNYLESIPRSIVKSLELLYTFGRYYDEMNKLLNFKTDKVGRTLRMFTGKE